MPVLESESPRGIVLLCLAGGQPWDRAGKSIPVDAEERVTRLVLIAPTVGWFQAPGALAAVRVPMTVVAWAKDSVTPAATTEILRSAPAHVDVTVHENAGHFDFMTDLPPGVSPTPGLDHAGFLRDVASKIAAAVA